jgi:hypothetical protein
MNQVQHVGGGSRVTGPREGDFGLSDGRLVYIVAYSDKMSIAADVLSLDRGCRYVREEKNAS